MKLRELNLDIAEKIEGAKRNRGMLDVDLAETLQMSTSTLRNLRCRKELYCLDYWRVAKIAELAGCEIRIERKR